MDDIRATMNAASSGLRAQTLRMRVAAENVANANSTSETPGGDPYRRRMPMLEERKLADGVRGVRVTGAADDPSAFRLQYNPSHPGADDSGYVKLPNVDPLIEMMDLREATRAYEANLNMIENARAMTTRALDMLRR
ncbi:MAG: flagellar basal body rod protein FlgC [Alphaproteobacteria bacterium]|nr:flagellar basal body rod protein FlgC [Alphaproteobacteria bacterium]